MSEDVKIGVPEGFYPNSYLISINKYEGWIPPIAREKGYALTLKCWADGCEEPLRLCGYPFYICNNNHLLNHQTGEKWLWKGYDEDYHAILDLLQGRVEPMYQHLFFPQSLKRENTEASRVATRLDAIGEKLYEALKIEEEDPYHWGKDTLRGFAGLRFAANIMHKAIESRRQVVFDSDRDPDLESATVDEKNEYDAHALWTDLGSDDAVKPLLMSVETVQKALPKQQKAVGLEQFF